MKKISFGIVCALVVMLFAGCTSVYPGGLGSGEMGGKVGEASQKTILFFTLNADVGIMAAARNGNISKVSAFDVKVFHVLPWYSERTTIVTGE